MNTENYEGIAEECVRSCLHISGLHQPKADCAEDCTKCSKWICLTCDRNLSLNKIPNQALANAYRKQKARMPSTVESA